MTSKMYPIHTQQVLPFHLNLQRYQALYAQSLEDPETFWAEQAQRFVTWFKPWEQVLKGNFEEGELEWFHGATLNACYNCLDRHLPKYADKIALSWEGNEAHETRTLTYAELFAAVCRFANVLKKWKIAKGDRVCIYLPMIPEALIAMLACARIGAIHSVIFAGFSPEAISNRLLDANCAAVITANVGLRGTKIIPLKKNIDMALLSCPQVKTVFVVKRQEADIAWEPARDHWYHEEMQNVAPFCPCEVMTAQDPLFILYTSGSTGKPKGILHATGGYLLYAACTYHYIFNYHSEDVYWCTADVGWITGHSYLLYGPLSCAATSLMYEGVPDYPTPARYWELVDKYQVNILYTSPTVLRALRREGNAWLEKTSRQSLQVLGTVGEPINPEIWEWYYEVVGNSRCPIVDTWWQTETGGILISALPGVTPLKPGSAAWPFFGIQPEIVDDQGQAVPANTMGQLVIKQPWPGMAKTIYGHPERFQQTYFATFKGQYLAGDNAYQDEAGYFWIAGRHDDVLKISGHRIGTAEVENAFLQNPQVAEAAVVGVPHEIKGEAIYAFITLKAGVEGSEALKKTLVQVVRQAIGGLAAPEHIQWAEALPKTRSGKIMRRLLRKIATQDLNDLGDISTLADPQVVEKLIQGR